MTQQNMQICSTGRDTSKLATSTETNRESCLRESSESHKNPLTTFQRCSPSTLASSCHQPEGKNDHASMAHAHLPGTTGRQILCAEQEKPIRTIYARPTG